MARRSIADKTAEFIWAAAALTVFLAGSNMAFEDEMAEMTPAEFEQAQCEYYNHTPPECGKPAPVVADNN